MKERFKRQSFLGVDSEELIGSVTIGLIGYGGGGSQVGQQLAHVGFRRLVVVDDDVVEDHNLNRLVGATAEDAVKGTPKVEVARRVIKGVLPKAPVRPIQGLWESVAKELRAVDLLIGCVDSFGQRDALERFCRRFLIPYIDIGMDVIASEAGHRIIGQVALSTPGQPCLRCMGIIEEATLDREERARQYGDAGSKPQVVWPNGVLASSAVGLAVQLITPWSGGSTPAEHLEYDGNAGTLQRAPRLALIRQKSLPCPHYRQQDVGDPLYSLAT